MDSELRRRRVDLSPVYLEIYQLLLDTKREKLDNKEFIDLVLGCRFEGNGTVLTAVRKFLLEQGFTKHQADKICSYTAWRMRFTYADSYEIKKVLKEYGFIQCRGRHIFLKKGSC